MKKYQLWLERKSYSQHLFNLMKIKYANRSSVDKNDHNATASVPRSPARDQTNVLSRYKQMEDYHGQGNNLGDISYAITYKELKNRKLRLMKTFEILNENMSMARRLKEVKSVFTNTFHNKHSSDHANKRKMFEKKCELSNEELRQQNFKKFVKWQGNKTNPFHKYQLSITVDSISKLLHSQSQYAAAWCEISTQKGFVRSDLVRLDDFQGHKFLFAVDQQLPKDCIYKLYICKGLDSNFIGQFQFKRPQPGQSLVSTHRSDDGQFEVTIRQKYDRVRKERPTFNPR